MVMLRCNERFCIAMRCKANAGLQKPILHAVFLFAAQNYRAARHELLGLEMPMSMKGYFLCCAVRARRQGHATSLTPIV